MRSARRSNRPTIRLSLDDVHQTIDEFVTSKAPARLAELKDSPPTIEDALQSIATVLRPKTVLDIESLGNTLLAALTAAGDDPLNWKLLALTIIKRRYHSKAPEARSLKAKDKNKKEAKAGDGDDGASEGTGHGERMSFYLLLVYLQVIARTELLANDFAKKMCKCLARLAFPAGGSRDVCALVEHLVYDELGEAGVLKIQKDEGNKRALCQAVIEFVAAKTSVKEEGITDFIQVSSVSDSLIQVASDLLDEDFALIASVKKSSTSEEDTPSEHPKKKQKICLKMTQDGQLQSTINTFIPHHGRGGKSRKLVQSIAELMIWSRAACTKADQNYSKVLADLSDLCSAASPNDDKIVKCVHIMQTSIRRFRKQLNASSREQGFSLCTSFEMDPVSITLGMIKTAKEGDVAKLNLLASKARNKPIVQMISHRYTDPAKAVSVESMRTLQAQWIRIDSKSNDGDDLDDLLLQIQEAAVKATIKRLRDKIPKSSDKKEHKNIIASLDQDAKADAAAILVAAAFDGRCLLVDDADGCPCAEHPITLYIGQEERTITSISDVMKVLDVALTKERQTVVDSDELATTKDIQNLIERHLEPGGNLILCASSDVKLEQRVLTNMKTNKSSFHCHVFDEWSFRMDREKAKIGDITVTLAWDNECDLDLHATCPNGDHISYANKQGGGVKGGGYLDVDMNAGNYSMEPVENIFFGDAQKGIEANHGSYKIWVQNYAYHCKTIKAGSPVPWRVRLVRDGQTFEYKGECVGTGVSSNVTVVEFTYTGRTAPPPEAVGSALTSSNLVSVTSSMGDSIDSVCELMEVHHQVHEMERVRELVAREEVKEEQADEGTNILMADRKRFEVTNRERLYLTLSQLPSTFHQEVSMCFGGQSLVEYTANALAKRLTNDSMRVDLLNDAGYPESLVEIVREKMTKFGIA